MFVKPDVTDFKEYFFRDFKYTCDGDLTGVTDPDIEKAQGEANVNFNESLFSDQETFSLCYNYLTAHYLVIDLRNSSQGINGEYSWIVSSKSVGSVSESFSIPESITKNPELAMLTKTNYGAKFISLILPLLAGQVLIAAGRTHA